MKKTKIFVLVAGMLTLGACDEFLSEAPDNRVKLDNVDKAAQLLTNAYTLSSYNFTDWMTDNVGFTKAVTLELEHEQAYAWDDINDDPFGFDTPSTFWFDSYEAIAHANEVLAVIDQLPEKSDEDKARKKAVESEALLTRAYAHFMLVNIFAKHYDEASAASDLGIPYVETPETEFLKKYTRTSVQDVYNKVERDLLKGISLADDTYFSNSGKYHFNKNAALAFASRYYLWKGDYENCLKYSNQLLGSSPSRFVRDMTSDEFLSAKSSSETYPRLYNSPELSANLMLIKNRSVYHYPNRGHGPLNTFVNELFGDTNLFPNTDDSRETPALVKGDNAQFPNIYEYLFQRSSLNSNVGTPYYIAIAFKGEEVLLNRMECYLYEGRHNEFVTDYQALAEGRYIGFNLQLSMPILRQLVELAPDDSRYDQNIIEYIYMNERRKEFMSQGLRWFDIKRFEIEVIHEYADGSTKKLKEKDLRKVIQIPSSAQEVGGLRPNPR